MPVQNRAKVISMPWPPWPPRPPRRVCGGVVVLCACKLDWLGWLERARFYNMRTRPYMVRKVVVEVRVVAVSCDRRRSVHSSGTRTQQICVRERVCVCVRSRVRPILRGKEQLANKS